MSELLLEQSRGRLQGTITERVRADELGEVLSAVGRGLSLRPHLPQLDRAAEFCSLPGRLAPGEPGTDNGYVRHQRRSSARGFAGRLFYAKSNQSSGRVHSASGSIYDGFLQNTFGGEIRGQEKKLRLSACQ